ncbi:BPTI/Kunitz domain-containing protein-like [Ornithodoros turicata]|uniref:BPTI/Kunitz domain-containing protein-like n=1 Tax=Ornithodoros turicata TaxID=34597 RepID=UPI0031392CD2
MTSVQSFLVGICVAIQTSVAYEYSYIDQLRMARTQADGGNATEICHLPKAEGPCNGHFPVYYFDAHQGQCIEFIYGGCYGNLNNFDTYYECRKTCAGQGDIAVCYLKPDKGPCKGYVPRSYYDPETKSCKRFIYGGCHGNGNNFDTQDGCMKACAKEIPYICRQPKQPGPCLAYFVRYYYDSVEGICKEFIYQGCEGNSNNFKTIEQCNVTCSG